jgi:uncharacterized Zn finger protein
MPNQLNPFRNMTLDDIDAWVEGPTADAGKKIHTKGDVSELALTEDGDLLAWVKGSPRHAVMVFFDDQILTSVCSCDKPNACEHAVATAFEALHMGSQEIELPVVTEDDERLTLLNDLNDEPLEIDHYLNTLSRDDLINLILDLADDIPAVEEDLSCRAKEAFNEGEI